MRVTNAAIAIGMLAFAAGVPVARADETTPPSVLGPAAPPPPPGSPAPPPSPTRPLPDYGGQPTPTTAGDVALWVPRVVFFPMYVVSEYVIRVPLGAGITAAERANLPTTLYNFFTFGPDHKVGFIPIALVDFGFQPSVGIYAFWDDAFFKGDDLRLHASTCWSFGRPGVAA
jgi:hypothetical protein